MDLRPPGAASEAGKLRVRKVGVPKAGGAIRGMGEKFQANEFSGAATLSVPIHTSPCRDAEPALSLGYNSMGGNNVFGLGWELDQGSFRRLTSKGVPTYTDGDIIVFDGETLVPSEAKPCHRTVCGVEYRVQRFRRRIEGAFERIEWWQQVASSESLWRVFDHHDTIRVYGLTTESRICDPHDTARIFEWKLAQRFDPRGDVSTYHYKREHFDDESAVYEVNRTQNANSYLERIRYGNDKPFTPVTGGIEPVPFELAWHFEVVFDYGEYDISVTNDDPHAPVRPWLDRPDPFSNYVAGFERRTHRLCRAVLMFHRFAELGKSWTLVHALNLGYHEDAVGSTLASATSVGYRHHPKRAANARYTSLATPSIDLGYVSFDGGQSEFREILDTEGNALPGLNGNGYQLVDLHGEGVPGVLFADGTTVHFWRPVIAPDATIRYRWTEIEGFPEQRRASGSDLELHDLSGAGRLDIVRTDPTAPGYFESEIDGTWARYRPLRSWPSDGDGLSIEHADLTGDGRTDTVRVLANAVEYYRSIGTDGFDAPRTIPLSNPLPLEFEGARSHFVGFADVIGAGTTQRVLISSGSVECWPSLGYGRFGEKVTIADAPQWKAAVSSEQIYLADVDGSGAADLVVAFADRVEVYQNLSGNRFRRTPICVELPRAYTEAGQITFADLDGSGYQQLVFTSSDPSPRQWVFDMSGGTKPFLLDRVANNLGANTVFSYASSVHFYLQDQAAGLPWITTLPFPVQVVNEVRVTDEFSKTNVVTSHRYHHGYYDPIEHEFRGFGMVERADVQTVAANEIHGGGSSQYVEPTRIKTWFETGAWFVDSTLAESYEHEYWSGDKSAYAMPADVIDWNGHPSTIEGQRQARVALGGHEIRQEVWGPESFAPLTVQQWNYTVRLDQPAGDHEYAVFFVHDREDMTSHYETVSDDPRVEHSFTLIVDAFGIVNQSCAIAYERRPCAERIPAQSTTWIDCEMHDVYPPQDSSDLYLVGVGRSLEFYRLEGFAQRKKNHPYYSYDEVLNQVAAALAATKFSGPTATLIAAERDVYVTSAELPAVPLRLTRNEHAEFTKPFITDLFGDQVIPGGLTKTLSEHGGFVYEAATKMWWNPGLTANYFDAANFYQLSELADAFVDTSDARSGVTTSYTYEPYSLLVAGVTTTPSAPDVLTETVKATSIDYQALDLRGVIDSNGNTSEVLTDELDRVVATTHYGTEYRGGAVVATGFSPFDFDSDLAWPIPESADALVADPGRYVRGAASFSYFDFGGPGSCGAQPAQVIECEAQQYPTMGQPNTMVGAAFIEATYEDGFGRILQVTEIAEPGIAVLIDSCGAPKKRAGGKIRTGEVQQRWRVSGRVEYNNKGLPSRRYEPYFASRCAFSDDRALATFGYSDTYHFDALDRVVRVDTPEGEFAEAFFSTTSYSAWKRVHEDAIDTVKNSSYYKHYITGGAKGLDRFEQAALVNAAKLADTPTTEVLDPLGRVVAHAEEAPQVETSTTGFDLLDRVVWRADARLGPLGTENVHLTYSMTGAELKVESVDAGVRWRLFDVFGLPIYSRDSNGNIEQPLYDSKHRPTGMEVVGLGLVERVVYGDSLLHGHTAFSHPTDRNLVGRPCVVYDQAQRTETGAYDLHGGWAEQSQHLRHEYRRPADWTADADVVSSWRRLFRSLATQLEDLAGYPGNQPYRAARRVDALGRVVAITDAYRNVVRYGLHVSGLLDSITCQPPGESAVGYVLGTDYNARKDRLQVRCGSLSGRLYTTSYRFDPPTLRLTKISTVRTDDQAVLQDLSYVYDPVGNITHVSDRAAIAIGREAGDRDLDYTYDSLYRVSTARGSAIAGFDESDQRTGSFAPFTASKRRPKLYELRYCYDAGENLRSMTYNAGAANTWTRKIVVAPDSNRAVDASLVSMGDVRTSALFDGNGNQLRMIGISSVGWDYRNRAVEITMESGQQGNDQATMKQFASYGESGSCVRRITTGGPDGETVEDTYLATGLQVSTLRSSDNLVTEQYTRLPLSDGHDVVADRLWWSVGAPDHETDSSPIETRYYLHNDLGSAVVEVDEQAFPTSVEEFSPFGSTVSASGVADEDMRLKKRRFSGKERNQASGLYDYGLRHFASWVGRWISPDPLGLIDGLNLYTFVGNNPIRFIDRVGACKSKKRKASSTKVKRGSSKKTDSAPSPVEPRRTSRKRKAVSYAGAQEEKQEKGLRKKYLGGTPQLDSGVGQAVLLRWYNKGKAEWLGLGQPTFRPKDFDPSQWKVSVRLVKGQAREWVPLGEKYETSGSGRKVSIFQMGHRLGAVNYWNDGSGSYITSKNDARIAAGKAPKNYGTVYDQYDEPGHKTGALSKTVKGFMSDARNYRIEFYSINASEGAKEGRKKRYRSPA